jgi:hypothetical protein
MYALWLLDFLWGFFIHQVFENNLWMLQQLQQNITIAISSNQKQTLKLVSGNGVCWLKHALKPMEDKNIFHNLTLFGDQWRTISTFL